MTIKAWCYYDRRPQEVTVTVGFAVFNPCHLRDLVGSFHCHFLWFSFLPAPDVATVIVPSHLVSVSAIIGWWVGAAGRAVNWSVELLVTVVRLFIRLPAQIWIEMIRFLDCGSQLCM